MTAVHEMIRHAYHRHQNNHSRDMTEFSHGMTAEEVGKLLADQPGNRGKTNPEEMQRKWTISERFIPMEVPIHAVHPVRVPSGRTKSRTTGPIVVELNFRHRPQLTARSGDKPDGFVPHAVIIDGQHRHNDAKNEGRETMQALVGEKAIPAVNASIIHEALRAKHFARTKTARQLYSKFVESEHPRDEEGKFEAVVQHTHLSEHLTREEAEKKQSLQAYFKNEEDAKAFLSKLPKSVKAFPVSMGTRTSDNNRFLAPHLIWHPTGDSDRTHVTHSVHMHISGVNKTTGELNEQGIKRRKRFLDLLNIVHSHTGESGAVWDEQKNQWVHSEKHSRQKYARQLYERLNGPMLYAGEWF